MDYGTLKLHVLQKIDIRIKDLTVNNNTRDYLNAMAGVVNRGLNDLATAGKFIIKKYIITQDEIKNILMDPRAMMDFVSHYKETIEYSAGSGKAYYFEVDNTATVEIYAGGDLFQKIEHTGKGFTAYKGFVSNPGESAVTIRFGGPFPYNIRNVAVYDQDFETEGDIWDFVPEKRYDLRQLIPDFYKLSDADIVLQSGINDVRYEKTPDYYFEGDGVLVLNGMKRGEWTVHYFAYPKMVNGETADDYELPLDPEVASLLVLYTASQLYEDDDRSLATMWRNDYEAGKSQLKPSGEHNKTTEFADVQGWY